MLLIVFPLVTPTVGSMSPWKIQENERHGVRENVTKSGKTEPKRASGLASVELIRFGLLVALTSFWNTEETERQEHCVGAVSVWRQF